MNLLPWGGQYTGNISLGCAMCFTGKKSVIFLTGYCNAGCFYCPVSNDKMDKPHLYINEKFIPNTMPIELQIKEIIYEIETCQSTGVSFTGGDPLLDVKKCLIISKSLREKFGKDFHIHLYSPGREANKEDFADLSKFIDEIRFHPRNKADLEALKLAIPFDWDVGLELPAIPGSSIEKFFNNILETYLVNSNKFNKKFIFLNLNELEISEANFKNLLKAKFIDKNTDEINIVIKESKLEAQMILEKNSKLYPNLNIHYCPAAEKDTQQLPNRLFLRANKIIQPGDIIIDEQVHKGLLLKGIIQLKNKSEKDQITNLLELEQAREIIINNFNISKNELVIDFRKKRIETHPFFIEDYLSILKELLPNSTFGISEEHPTFERIETSFIPL